MNIEKKISSKTTEVRPNKKISVSPVTALKIEGKLGTHIF